MHCLRRPCSSMILTTAACLAPANPTSPSSKEASPGRRRVAWPCSCRSPTLSFYLSFYLSLYLSLSLSPSLFYLPPSLHVVLHMRHARDFRRQGYDDNIIRTCNILCTVCVAVCHLSLWSVGSYHVSFLRGLRRERCAPRAGDCSSQAPDTSQIPQITLTLLQQRSLTFNAS